MMQAVVVYPDGHVGEKRGDSWWGVPQAIPMQFTNLKDKNGKEIYEGDIVQYKNRGNKPVGFLKGEFILLNENGDFYDSVGAAHEECEVIGNINENPDLLPSPDNQ